MISSSLPRLSRRQINTSASFRSRTASCALSITQRSPLRPLQATISISKPQLNPRTTNRTFGLPSLASLLPNGDNKRVLTATRTLPYAPSPLFDVISAVESYSQFLPFLTASTVTARDAATGLPTAAYLTVGYGVFSETFTSRVICDRANWRVEARSGDKEAEKNGFVGANEGIFEYLSTRWDLVPLTDKETKVQLEIRFEFRNQLHAAVMSAVEAQMAPLMIEAFEKRIREVQGR